jgi:hypothetical protein
MHHQIQEFGNLGLKGLDLDSGFSGHHFLLTERSEKSRYSELGFKIKLAEATGSCLASRLGLDAGRICKAGCTGLVSGQGQA